jgi:hypothetical protein
VVELVDIGDKDLKVRSLTTVGGDIYSPQFSIIRTRVLQAESDLRRIDTGSQAAIERVRHGDLVDGAIARLKLEAGFIDEHDEIYLDLFPYGTGQSKLSVLEPSTLATQALIEQALDLIKNTEEGVHSTMRQTTANGVKISSIEQDIDTISMTVSELYGGTVDLTIFTQTKNKIDMIATSGEYSDNGTIKPGWAKANIDVMARQISLVVEANGPDNWKVAETIITEDSIASKVAGVIIADSGVQTTISNIVQTSDAINLSVERLRSETQQKIDEVWQEMQAGISITSDQIIMAVFGEQRPGDTPLQTQVSLLAGSFSVLTEGYGSSAFLGMSTSVPVMITASKRAEFVGYSNESIVAACYQEQNDSFVLRSGVTNAAYKLLKDALRAHNALGSMIALDADEILMGGKVHAGSIYVDQAFVTKLGSPDEPVAEMTLGWLTLAAGKITGKLEANQIKVEDLQITNGNISGVLAGNKIDVTTLDVTDLTVVNIDISGNTRIGNTPLDDIYVKKIDEAAVINAYKVAAQWGSGTPLDTVTITGPSTYKYIRVRFPTTCLLTNTALSGTVTLYIGNYWPYGYSMGSCGAAQSIAITLNPGIYCMQNDALFLPGSQTLLRCYGVFGTSGVTEILEEIANPY